MRLGKFSIVASEDVGEDEIDVAVLDTNVVIDIERLVFKGPSADLVANLAPFLEFLARRRDSGMPVLVDGSLAFAEASSVRTAAVDPVRYRRVRYATTAAAAWTMPELTLTMSSAKPHVDRNPRWYRRVPLISDSESRLGPAELVYLAYGINLQALAVLSDYPGTAQQMAKKRVTRFLDWIEQDARCVTGYAVTNGIHLLAGTPEQGEHARRLLKTSGAESPSAMATRAWNGAWDMEILARGDDYTLGGSRAASPRRTVVVSGDLDTTYLRSNSEPAHRKVFADREVGWTQNHTTTVATLDDHWLRARIDACVSAQRAIALRGKGAAFTQLSSAVRSLEDRLQIDRAWFDLESLVAKR